eukprot:m.15584 g.15584  ORF g.15584 m.15584 type:complete len:407 (-) comp6673_c0_seq1:209-1429(-)
MAEVRQRHKAKSNVKASGKGDRSPPSNSSTAVDEQPAQKNVLVAYLLYFFGGALGWHHLYLDREAQASLWSVTGGGFGFGLLFDFFRIPSYVSEANIDDVFRDSRRHRNRCQNIIRTLPLLLGIVVFVPFVRMIVLSALPHHPENMIISSRLLCVPLGALATSMLTIALSTQSYRQVRTKAVLVASVLMELYLAYAYTDVEGDGSGGEEMLSVEELATYSVGTVSSNMLALVVAFTLKYTQFEDLPRAPKRRGSWRKIRNYTLIAVLFWLLVGSNVLYNTTLGVDENGEPKQTKKILEDFFNSEQWQIIKQRLGQAASFCAKNPGECFNTVSEWFEEHNTSSAYQTLGLSDNATDAEVKKAYRQKMRQFHPDKCATSGCAKMYRAVQQARDRILGEKRGSTRSRSH